MNRKSQWANGPISKQDTKQDHEEVSSVDGRREIIRLDDISGDEIDEVSSIKVPKPRRRYTNPLANDASKEHSDTEKTTIDANLRNPLSSNEGPVSSIPSSTYEGLQPALYGLRQSDDCKETLTDENKRSNGKPKSNNSLRSTTEEIGTVSKSLNLPEYGVRDPKEKICFLTRELYEASERLNYYMKGTSVKKATKTELLRLGRRLKFWNMNPTIQGSMSGNETNRGIQWSTKKEERMKIFSNATRATIPVNLTTDMIVQKCTPPAPFRRTSYPSVGKITSTCKEHVTQSTASIETVVNNLGLGLRPILTIPQKWKSNSEYETARPEEHLHYRKPDCIDSVCRPFSVAEKHVTKATGSPQYEYSPIQLLTLSDHTSPVRNVKVYKHKKDTRKDWKKTRSSTFDDSSICHLPDVYGGEKRPPNISGRNMNNQFPSGHLTRNPADDLPASRAKIMTVFSAPPLPRGKKYHVFFSYGHVESDESWVRWVITILESAPLNYNCCFDKRDFMPGQPILDNTELAIRESLRVVIVLTNEYIKCERCQRESDMIQICKASIIPLQLNNCHIPIKLNILSSITVSNDNCDWWVPFQRALKGKIPHLQSPKQDHVFLFHGDSVRDTERIKLLMTALESSEYEFRCTSTGKNFLSGQTIDGNIIMHADKAALTIVAFSKYIHKNTWLNYWQKLRDQGVHIIPLMFDRIQIQGQLKGIVIFDATKEQDIWLPSLIEQLMKYMDIDKRVCWKLNMEQ